MLFCPLSPVPLKHTQEWPERLSSRRKPCTPIPWEEKAQSCIEQPENTRVPLESAKAEVQKPFPQEEELAAKTARLNELNALPNPDKKENEIVDGERGEEEPQKSSAGRER